MLEAIGLVAGYSGKGLLGPFMLSLRSGIVVSLIGSNGVGKSTLLRTLSGEQPAIEGEVRLLGRPIGKWRRRELASRLSIVTTERVVSGGLTVNDLVAMGRQPHTGLTGRMSRHDREVVTEAISEVGLGHKSGSFLSELSDGERQKAMIAKALTQETPVMLLDEPFSFLDPAARIEIFLLLKRVAREHDRAVLLTSHDVAQSMRMASEIWLLAKDRSLIAGPPAELIASGAVDRLFDSGAVRFSSAQQDFIAASDVIQ